MTLWKTNLEYYSQSNGKRLFCIHYRSLDHEIDDRKTTLGALWIAGAAWLLAFVAARAALETMNPDDPLKVVAALMPVVPATFFLWFFVAYLRGLDELQRRFHLEALSIAYPLATLFLWTLGLLQLAIDLPNEDWSYRHIWSFLPMFYFIGLVIAWRRYR